jgi:glycosyltransferase involved in cell wall biosynthesis
MGIPIVASNVGGIPSVLRDFYNGFLCDPERTDAFVKRIRLLYDDRVLKTKLSANARRFAEENLDINTMNEQYMKTFLNIISV